MTFEGVAGRADAVLELNAAELLDRRIRSWWGSAPPPPAMPSFAADRMVSGPRPARAPSAWTCEPAPRRQRIALLPMAGCNAPISAPVQRSGDVTRSRLGSSDCERRVGAVSMSASLPTGVAARLRTNLSHRVLLDSEDNRREGGDAGR